MSFWAVVAILFLGACGSGPAPTAPRVDSPILQVVAESNGMIWNAVAVDGERTFVSGPRWTGSKGPALAELDSSEQPRPYPDAAWNSWHPGVDPAHSFVNVNAIRMGGPGELWVVDSGSPDFGANPLPGGTKLVRINLSTNQPSRVYLFPSNAIRAGSYVDDVRFNGDFAYATDAGSPGLIVIDFRTGVARRVLENHASTTAPTNRSIVLEGKTVMAPDGTPLKVNADPLELSPDGQWLYYGPLAGPWSMISTKTLNDPALPATALAAQVRPWADLPPTGGTVMDHNGDLYFSDLANNSLKRRTADGQITTIVQDPRLLWVDAPTIDATHTIWLPAAQVHRVALFQHGEPKTAWPVQLFRYQLGSR